MKNRGTTQQVLIFCLAALLLTACGAQQVAEFPYGSFRSLGGRHLTFTEDGTWSFALVAGQPVVTGEISVDGTQITFGEEMPAEGQNVPICEQGHTYTWSYVDDTLTFKPNGDDPCSHRGSDLGASFVPAE